MKKIEDYLKMETLDYLNELRDNADNPEKVKAILLAELERRIFEDVSWEIEHQLFIEANQE